MVEQHIGLTLLNAPCYTPALSSQHSQRVHSAEAKAEPRLSMAAQAQAQRNTITIRGSTKIVTEFFAYAVNR